MAGRRVCHVSQSGAVGGQFVLCRHVCTSQDYVLILPLTILLLLYQFYVYFTGTFTLTGNPSIMIMIARTIVHHYYSYSLLSTSHASSSALLDFGYFATSCGAAQVVKSPTFAFEVCFATCHHSFSIGELICFVFLLF